MSRTCKAPGCETSISGQNKSRLCSLHNVADMAQLRAAGKMFQAKGKIGNCMTVVTASTHERAERFLKAMREATPNV